MTLFLAPSVQRDVVYGALWQFGRYPASVYRQPLRLVLTGVLPVAFIATVPAWALTRGAGLILIVVGLVIGIGAIALVGLVWKAGLKRYTSDERHKLRCGGHVRGKLKETHVERGAMRCIVIGAGIIGTTVAWRLAQRRSSVTEARL